MFQKVYGHDTSVQQFTTYVITTSICRTIIPNRSITQHVSLRLPQPHFTSSQLSQSMSEATQPTDPTANPESQTAPKGLGAGEPTQPTESPIESPTPTTVESFEIQEAAANQATEEAYDAADWMQPAAARWLSPPSSCLGRPLPGNTGWPWLAKG